jgi:uncharacterized repeat protein (TIGR02543 family)
VQGHGKSPEDYFGIKSGSNIEEPEAPVEDGYVFDGWYKEKTCKNKWNFDNEIVQSDLTLYAKWLKNSGDFRVQEIADVYYTGKAQKPSVSIYDGDTLLRINKDYKITYVNNTNANRNGKQAGAVFDEELPYAVITGKGNYDDEIKINFNILPAEIGDGSETPAAGFTLKCNDNLEVSSKKGVSPFVSLKGKKTMRKDVDFAVTLSAQTAFDDANSRVAEESEMTQALIPAGYTGSFLLEIKGQGNYAGSVCRTIYVADKSHLMKNAKITLGKNIKSVDYEEGGVTLTSSDTDSPDTFTVRCGGKILAEQTDYKVTYRNNDSVGKAELVITGTGDYTGSKTVTFQIKGKPFNAKKVTVEGLANQTYTGRAITQNKVSLTYEGEPLEYGTDYTIEYSKNINKGTASMTFRGAEKQGYSGSFRKTFKISAEDLSKVTQASEMKAISVEYTKAGVKPAEQIVLTGTGGVLLENGRDYTVKYQNNKAAATANDAKAPTMLIKGKGNYTGQLEVKFTIRPGRLDGEQISFSAKAVAYNQNKPADYVYKISVKVLDQKSAMRVNQDYEITYLNNTQADYEAYLEKLASGQAHETDMPRAEITAKEGGNYKSEKAVIVPLPIYNVKLTKSNVEIQVAEAVYTGEQVTPDVIVYYQGERLVQDTDFSVSYGTNITAGKNKGTVKITGLSPYYGGDVTVKFDINRKKVGG